MMRMEQHRFVAVIEPNIGHHLVEIELSLTTLGIIPIAVDTLPFSVDHHHSLASTHVLRNFSQCDIAKFGQQITRLIKSPHCINSTNMAKSGLLQIGCKLLTDKTYVRACLVWNWHSVSVVRTFGTTRGVD
jgi:hypothetical protein